MPAPTSAIWFRKNGGIWNNDASADPATNTGGIDLSAISGQTLYATGQGTGDALQTFNFGASSFSFSVPAGFTAGWPHSGGGFTSFDPATAQGSVQLTNSNLTLGNNTTPGMCQSLDGYAAGKLYFEYTCGHQDLFNNFAGGGVGRLNALLPQWVGGGGFNSMDPNGGGVCIGGFNSSWICHIFALTVDVLPAPFVYIQDDIISVAVLIGGSGPPPSGATVTTAELWFGQTGGFVDMSVESNRRKFIALSGGAPDLGVDGSAPFGVSPPVYLTRRGVPATFAANNGRGGPFIVSGGSLVAGSTEPPPVSTSVTTPQSFSPGQGLLGDYRNGNLYAFNPATYTDDGTRRIWLRRWRALAQGGIQAKSFHYVAVSMQTGIGVLDTENPQVMLRWSDDGGHSWSNYRILPVGRKGATKFTVKANRLGATRRFSGSDRIFEMSSTDPFKVAILDADVDVS